MPELHIRLPEELRLELRDWLTQVLAQRNPARENLYLPDESDPEMQAMWLADLQEAERDDLALLLGLLEEEGFGECVVRIAPETTEGIIRGAASARLRLRTHELATLTDAALENGDWDFKTLPAQRQWAAYAYILLAAIQEYLIAQISGVTESG